MYADYVDIITKRLEEHLSKIDAHYGFDYGDEFEFALIDFLNLVLPEKFGVRRGHAVSFDDQLAGDDLIIFDRIRMPTIGLRDGFEKYRKTKIPIEAIYGYIEAKHTIILEGDGGQSFTKARMQVGAVKDLCERRIKADLNVAALPPELHFPALNGGYPERLDPTLGVIFARNVKIRPTDKSFATSNQIEKALHRIGLGLRRQSKPDLLVLGSDVIVTPHLDYANDSGSTYVSPFCIPSRSNFGINILPGKAASVALLTMMYALELIKLGPMPWRAMIEQTLGPLSRLRFKSNSGTHASPSQAGSTESD
jgi:hypothetical protein